jgi:hypothetical protein
MKATCFTFLSVNMKRVPAILFLFFLYIGISGSIHKSTMHSTEREVKLKMTFKVNVSGHVKSLRLKMVIPANIKGKQTIDELSFSIEPDSFYTTNNNSYVLFKFYDVEEDFKIILKSRITIYNTINTSADTSKTDFSKYLISESNIEASSEKIIAVAESLKRKTDIETIVETFDYVKKHISYKIKPAIGAEKVLETGVGKCMDFSDLFVALLRANKIPAKSVFGIVVNEISANPLHAWSEAYLKKQGWVRFDATSGHSDIRKEGPDYKMRLSNKYVTLSEGRNDPEMRTSLFRYRYIISGTGSVNIKHNVEINGQ